MKIKYSKKIFVISLVGLIVVLVLDIVFTNFLIQKIISINNKIKQINISSLEREKELVLEGLVANSDSNRQELEKYFVGAGNVEAVNFTKYLEDLALEMGVSQKKSLVDEPVKGLESSKVVSSIRFRFNVSGKWEKVYNFLLAIENLPKVVLLNNVSFNINSDSVSTEGGKIIDKIWSVDLDFSVVKLK